MHRMTLAALVTGLIVMSLPGAMAQGEPPMTSPTRTGQVDVNGVELYYEVHGQGSPLVMLHGGVNPSDMFGVPLARMAESHEVLAIHLRGHGLSTDTDEPWSYEQMADDVVALLDALNIERIDVMGWSLGGGVALQTAIRHPERVGRLVVIGSSVRSGGNFPEVQAMFDAMPDMAAEIAQQVEQSPLATLYPDRDWTSMFRKSGEMGQRPHDWSEDVAGITAPTLLIFADAEMMHLEHIVEIYRLFGGGTRDAGVDGALRPTQNQLAIVPGTTHYNLVQAGAATDFAKAFLAGPN
jgi:pimeloyl-ACP methyl ester carboxylesterase